MHEQSIPHYTVGCFKSTSVGHLTIGNDDRSVRTHPHATKHHFKKLRELLAIQQEDVQTVLMTSIADGVGRLFARTTPWNGERRSNGSTPGWTSP